MPDQLERSDDRKIDKLFSLVSDLRVQGEKRTGQIENLHTLMDTKVTNIEVGLAQHVAWEEAVRERDIQEFQDHIVNDRIRFSKIEDDLTLLKAARSRADGAKSFVEWVIRYGWAVVVGTVGAAYYFVTGKAS